MESNGSRGHLFCVILLSNHGGGRYIPFGIRSIPFLRIVNLRDASAPNRKVKSGLNYSGMGAVFLTTFPCVNALISAYLTALF